MILVDLYVPVVDKVYDFNLDETKQIRVVIEDIADMICQKEQWQMHGDISKLSLWLVEEHRRLNRLDTLSGNGIRSGMRLLLV